jgi:hypothetical protein
MPETRFVPNPVTTDLYRKYTISFPGGSLTATKDVLTSMFEADNLPDTCSPETKEVSRKESLWTRYPGDQESQRVQPYTYTLKNYSNGGNSRAAAGEPIKILINNDYWTARLVGSHQAFMDYLCQQKEALVDGFTYWQSEKGSPYFITDNSTSN